MKFEGELPRGVNRRGGPGWWMDNEGRWRAPEEWPEDYPPLSGWVRTASGRWSAPTGPAAADEQVETRWNRPAADGSSLAVIDEPEAPSRIRRSRQARADRRAMFLVTGAIGGALLLLIGALVLIAQAGATQDPDAAEVAGPVVYAAETEQDLTARRVAAAAKRPELAREQLAVLPEPRPLPEPTPLFDATEWVVSETGCLSIAEQVLLARSAVEVTFADNMECVPDAGSWPDVYVGRTITRTLDAEVVMHIPHDRVWAAGGWNWTPATRQAFLTDVDHPATQQVVAAGTGHNPRAQGPADWRPGNSDSWCSYAVDWIAVSHRWNLSVTDGERLALTEMLDSCAAPGSSGANVATTTLDEPALPAISLLGQ